MIGSDAITRRQKRPMKNANTYNWIRYILVFAAVFVAVVAGLGVRPALAQGGGGGQASAPAESEGSATGPFYLKLGAFQAPIVEKRQIKGYAEVVVTVEVADREGEKAVQDKTLILRDEFLRDLQFQAGMRSEGDPAINLKRIKARFKVLAVRVVGQGVVTEVLIESAMYHGT